MRKFKFSLQFLLNVRQSEEKAIKAELYALRSEIAKLEQEYQVLLDRQQMYADALKEKVAQGITSQNLHNWNSYLSDLKTDSDAKAELIASAKEECNEILNKLIEVKKSIKMLEILKDKKYQEYLQEEAKEESKIIDEYICANYAR